MTRKGGGGLKHKLVGCHVDCIFEQACVFEISVSRPRNRGGVGVVFTRHRRDCA